MWTCSRQTRRWHMDYNHTIPWTSQGPCRWQTSVGRPATSSTWSRWLGLEMPWRPWHDSCSSLEVQLAVERSWLSFQSSLTCLIWTSLSTGQIRWSDGCMIVLWIEYCDTSCSIPDRERSGLSTSRSLLKMFRWFYTFILTRHVYPFYLCFMHFILHWTASTIPKASECPPLAKLEALSADVVDLKRDADALRCRAITEARIFFTSIRTVVWCNVEEDVEEICWSGFRWEADLGMPWQFELHLDRNVYTNYDTFFLKLLKLLKFWRLW